MIEIIALLREILVQIIIIGAHFGVKQPYEEDEHERLH